MLVDIDGTPYAVKVACTVWSWGKSGDYIKGLPIAIECIERNLDPLTTEIVVMSRADNTGSGLILASFPETKKRYGITNVSRIRDLPQPFLKTLHVVPPRMKLYIKRNMQVNNIFRRYVVDEDLLIYSITEYFLRLKEHEVSEGRSSLK